MLKIRLLHHFMILFILFSTLSAYSQGERKNKKIIRQEEFKEIKSLIEGRVFKFVGERAYPLGMQPMDLFSNPNYLLVNDTIAHSEMPFFGRAYVAPYNNEETGMHFEGKMEEISFKVNDKKLIARLEFKVRDKADVFRVAIEAGYGGDATMYISSNNKSSISYQGTVMEVKKEEPDSEE